jgi:hypothetical protein
VHQEVEKTKKQRDGWANYERRSSCPMAALRGTHPHPWSLELPFSNDISSLGAVATGSLLGPGLAIRGRAHKVGLTHIQVCRYKDVFFYLAASKHMISDFNVRKGYAFLVLAK